MSVRIGAGFLGALASVNGVEQLRDAAGERGGIPCWYTLTNQPSF